MVKKTFYLTKDNENSEFSFSDFEAKKLHN